MADISQGDKYCNQRQKKYGIYDKHNSSKTQHMTKTEFLCTINMCL